MRNYHYCMSLYLDASTHLDCLYSRSFSCSTQVLVFVFVLSNRFRIFNRIFFLFHEGLLLPSHFLGWRDVACHYYSSVLFTFFFFCIVSPIFFHWSNEIFQHYQTQRLSSELPDDHLCVNERFNPQWCNFGALT